MVGPADIGSNCGDGLHYVAATDIAVSEKPLIEFLKAERDKLPAGRHPIEAVVTKHIEVVSNRDKTIWRNCTAIENHLGKVENVGYVARHKLHQLDGAIHNHKTDLVAGDSLHYSAIWKFLLVT